MPFPIYTSYVQFSDRLPVLVPLYTLYGLLVFNTALFDVRQGCACMSHRWHNSSIYLQQYTAQQIQFVNTVGCLDIVCKRTHMWAFKELKMNVVEERNFRRDICWNTQHTSHHNVVSRFNQKYPINIETEFLLR